MTAPIAFPIPATEVTRRMVDAALGETERVMVERGASYTDITAEFMGHALRRLWDEEDREALRAKAMVLVDAWLDGLFLTLDGGRT